MKKAEIITCSWCGTKMRDVSRVCPRGPQCALNEANHDYLMQKIREQDKAKREAK